MTDVVKQLKLKDVRTLKAPYGELPDLAQVNFDTTSFSPGTAQHPAFACPTAIGSPPTERD